jgi:E3 ubiquitin-protein ligase HERC3
MVLTRSQKKASGVASGPGLPLGNEDVTVGNCESASAETPTLRSGLHRDEYLIATETRAEYNRRAKRKMPDVSRLERKTGSKDRQVKASGNISLGGGPRARVDITGHLGWLPREVLEQILGYLEPRELAMLDMTCRFFTESGITNQVARHHLKNVARAKGITPHSEMGETNVMLLDFVKGQSAAAAQGTAVALGTYHTLVLLGDEEGSSPEIRKDQTNGTYIAPYSLYSCGRGFHGQLGLGGHASFSTLTRVSQVDKSGSMVNISEESAKSIRLAVVNSGSSHSLAISRRGELFTWGLSSSGELGHGTWSPTEVSIPMLVSSFGKTRIVSVCSGANHTLAISESGQLWSSGRNRHGQLGQGHMMDEASFSMVDLIRNHRIVSVAAGKFHSMALASDGKLFTWGNNSFGQLGFELDADYPSPSLVGYLNPAGLQAGARVTAIAAGGYHSFALTVSGQLMATGRHKEGQLGLGKLLATDVHRRFCRVPFRSSKEKQGAQGFTATRVIQIQCGYLHSMALVQFNGKREVRSCGDNTFGQLGLRLSPMKCASDQIQAGHPRVDTFTKISMEDFDFERIVCVASGDWHSAAISEEGKLFTWGRGDCGQLGHGNDISYWRPRMVSWPTHVPHDKSVPCRVVHPDRTLRRSTKVAKEAVILTSPLPECGQRFKSRKRSAP